MPFCMLTFFFTSSNVGFFKFSQAKAQNVTRQNLLISVNYIRIVKTWMWKFTPEVWFSVMATATEDTMLTPFIFTWHDFFADLFATSNNIGANNFIKKSVLMYWSTYLRDTDWEYCTDVAGCLIRRWWSVFYCQNTGLCSPLDPKKSFCDWNNQLKDMESRLLGEAELKSWGREDGSWTIVHHRNTAHISSS